MPNDQWSASEMATQAIDDALSKVGQTINDMQFLSSATVGADLAAPGFANLIQGQYRAAPMQTASFQGICASGVARLSFQHFPFHFGKQSVQYTNDEGRLPTLDEKLDSSGA